MRIEQACTAPVPVPSTFLLFGSGMLVMIVYVWRRERNSKLNTSAKKASSIKSLTSSGVGLWFL